MTDRTLGSVRTGSRTGHTPDPNANGAGDQVPVSATQAIPTGTQRAQSAEAATKDAAASSGSSGSSGPSGPSGPAVGTAAGKTAGSGKGATGSSSTGAADAAATTAAVQAPANVAGGKAPTGKAPAAKGRGTSKSGGRGPRRARLQLRHIDTWSALKISLVLSIALFFIWMVAVGVLYGVLSGLGVFDTLNDLFGQLSSASGSDGGGEFITAGVVFGGAAIIGAVNIVLMTALCTVGTFIYNLCSDLVGGLELTLSERD